MEDTNNLESHLVTEDKIATEQPANKDIDKTNVDEQRKVPTPAELSRQKIISSAVSRVILKEKKLDEYDPWVQTLVKKEINSLETLNETKETEIERKVQESIQNTQADTEYNNYVETLSDDDKSILEAEVNQLKAYWMPKDVALTYAKQKIVPQWAPLPPAWRPMAPKTFNRVSIDKFDLMPSEQRAEYTKKSLAEFGEIAFS